MGGLELAQLLVGERFATNGDEDNQKAQTIEYSKPGLGRTGSKKQCQSKRN